MSAELKGEMEKAITLAGGTSLVWEEKVRLAISLLLNVTMYISFRI